MSTTFRSSIGRKVIGLESADELGSVNHFLLDLDPPRIAALVIGKGRSAQLVPWQVVNGVGPDAIMVGGETPGRAPANDWERAGADGDLEVLGKLALSEWGNELGVITDVAFDDSTGYLEDFVVDREVNLSPNHVLGVGPYAVVFAVPEGG
jgi:uncharacterized protein YrrD